MRRPRAKAGGKWVFKPDHERTPDQIQEDLENRVHGMLLLQSGFAKDFADRCKMVEAVQDYLPGRNKVPDGGAWILVKTPPPTNYTVPPLSIWFAEPWPMICDPKVYRVKIITPLGELGVFPREYSLIENPEKFYPFIGDGMEVKFFGNEDGIPRDKLFYLRSRGVSKADAIVMLIGSIKAHGVMWIESTRETTAAFGCTWPEQSQLATL